MNFLKIIRLALLLFGAGCAFAGCASPDDPAAAEQTDEQTVWASKTPQGTKSIDAPTQNNSLH